MLIAEQANYRRACKSESLQPLYEQAITLLERIKLNPVITDFVVQHIYREYNADADGLCNAILDTVHHKLSDNFFIEENWT